MVRGVRRRRRVAAVLAVLAAVGVMAACAPAAGSASGSAPSAASGSGTISVVAGENVWGDVAAQIGGRRVTVTSILGDPSTDPHEYESDPRDAAAVAGADLVVLNGAGYDDAVATLVRASPRRGRTVVSVAELAHVRGDDPNPHLWYDPRDVTAAAAGITAALSRADPSGAAAFAAHEKAFLAAYQPYVDTLATIRARYGGTAIAYTERVPGYLTAAAGLRLGTPAGFSRAVEDDADPSAADTRAFDAAITSHAVSVLLYNRQVTDEQTTAIKQLARRSGVPIVGVSETIPADQHSFQAWQIHQARQVLTALGG